LDFDIDHALNEMVKTVRAGGVARCVKRLLAYCRKEDPSSDEWDRLQKLPFEADAERIAQEIEVAFRSRKITARHKGFYFGLDGLNMPKGKEIEFGCSTKFDPKSNADEWVSECDFYFRTIKSKVLSAAYRIVEGAGIGDYVLCLGYTGLALRAAFEAIDPEILLGKAKSRGVCWGFHDGDLFNLGIITSKGFKLNLPDARPANPVIAISSKKKARHTIKGPCRWIQLADEFACQSPTNLERARALASVANCYCEVEEYKLARKCLAKLIDLMKSGAEFKEDFLFKMDMEWIHDATKNLAGAIAKPFIPKVLFIPDEDVSIEDSRKKRQLESAVKKALSAAKSRSAMASKQLRDAIAEIVASNIDGSGRQTPGNAFRKLFESLVNRGMVNEASALAVKVDMGDEFIEILWRSNRIPEYRAALRARFPSVRESEVVNGHHAITSYKQRAELQAKLRDSQGAKQTLKSAEEFAKLVFEYRRGSLWMKACVCGTVALIARSTGDMRKSDAVLAEAERYAQLQSKSKDAKDNATTAWLSVTDDYAEAGLLDDAIRSASRIPSRESRLHKLGSLLAQSGREGEAEALLSECKTLKAKVDLVLWIARHLIRIKESSESN
jgi:hypothetical protein